MEQLEKDALTITATINELSKTKSDLFKEVEKRKSSIIFINELLERMLLLKLLSRYYTSMEKRLPQLVFQKLICNTFCLTYKQTH